MAESRNHLELVQVALKYIKGIISSEMSKLIQIDSPDTKRPEMIDRFIPDILLEEDSLLIIGEAKTIKDLERKHSLDQYEAYLRKCQSFIGDKYIVISVPWQITRTAKNLFRSLKNKYSIDVNVKIVVINELGENSKI